jgi:hypothetical protein
LFSQILTLYVTPTFYASMERVAALFRRSKQAPAAGH